MGSLNLNPVTKTDRPTSHVTVSQRKVGSATVIEVEHNNRSGFFYVDAEHEVLTDSIQNDVLVHENVAKLFGGINRGRPFRVKTDPGLNDVPVCDSAKLYTENGNEDRLCEHMVDEHALLHRSIEEVLEVHGDLVTVDVVDLQPANYSTLLVTGATDIEFVSKQEAREASQSRDQRGGTGGGPSGPGDRGGGGGGGGGDEDVDIDVTPEVPTVNFEDDVAGLEEVKRTARMLLALFDPEVQDDIVDLYGEEFVSRGGSMLLYGPPGCGKTLVSEAIAYEAANETNIEDEYGDVKFLPVKGGDILSRYPGEAERRVEAVFEEAHSVAQDGFAVLFFDEIETLIPDRGDDDLQRHERSLTNAFLQEMGTDKVEDNLFVIGATNMPFTIDPAAARRFPVQQFIPQPGPDVMAQVWRKELSAMEAANDAIEIDYDELGEISTGYTPAEIADRVLGTELQRDLIHSVVDDDREAILPDTDYFMQRLEESEPKTIRQYINSVSDDTDSLEGYPEMRRYVEEQAEKLDISLGGAVPGWLRESAPEAAEDG